MLLGCLGRSRWSGHWLDWLSGRVASSLESCVLCVSVCVCACGVILYMGTCSLFLLLNIIIHNFPTCLRKK
jgi:hypothetical protein